MTGQVISSTAYNTFLNDIATEMSFSIDLRGETVFTAALNMGAQQINNVAQGVAPTDVANVSQLGLLTPVGAIINYPSATPPSANYMLCNGAAVSRSTYSGLFTLIGTTFGIGDGSTTFNLPNVTGKFVQGNGTVGATGGAATTALAITNLPAHNHAVTDPSHNHGDPGHTHGASTGSHSHSISDPTHAHTGGAATSGLFGVGSSFPALLTAGNTGAAATGISIVAVGNLGVTVSAAVTGIQAAVTGISTQNTGSGTAFSNLPPFINLSYMIRVI